MDSLIPFLYDSFIRTNLPVYPGVPGHRHAFKQLLVPVQDDGNLGACGFTGFRKRVSAGCDLERPP